MRLTLASIAAVLIAAPAIAQRTTHYQSHGGAATVRVGADGYGFAGEVDASGKWHGIDTNGRRVQGHQPADSRVRFFDADNAAEFNANVPFVRMDALGRVSVDMNKGRQRPGLCVQPTSPMQSRTAHVRELCRRGRLEAAYEIVEVAGIGSDYATVEPTVASMVAFRNHDFEHAAEIVSSMIEVGGADSAIWSWTDLKQCYLDEADYLSDANALRAATPTPSVRMLSAVHCNARGQAVVARAQLEKLLADRPTDVIAAMLLSALPSQP